MSDENPQKTPQIAAQGASLLQAARKHVLLMVVSAATVFAVVAVWTVSQVRVFRSEALLRLDPDPPKPLGQKVEVVGGNNMNYWNRREFYETEYRVMRSRRVALAAVRMIRLHENKAFIGSKKGLTVIPEIEAADLLISRLSVQPVKDSSLAILQYEDSDPERCEVVLRAVVRAYLAQNVENATTMSTTALEWLNTQVDDLKSKLEKSEVAIKDFREKNHVISLSLEDRHNILASQREFTAKELEALESKRAELAARVAELAKIDSSDPQAAGAVELLGSSVLNVLRASYDDQREKLEELLAIADEKNPKVLGARSKLAETAKAISKEIDNIKKAAAGDLRRVQSQIADRKKRDDELQKQAHELQAFEVPYNQLVRTKTNNEKIYSLVLERARETDLTRMMNFNNIRVIDDATRPKVAVRPNTPINLAAGLLGGVLFGLALALLRELSDRTLKTPAEAESDLGLTCLGLLPDINLVQRGRRKRQAPLTILSDRDLIVAAQPDGGVAEAARSIRTNLTFMSPDRPYHSLLVTSAVPEEGKTTVACSIATVLAQSGHRVLLVDTDLRRPRLHRTFKLANDVGVTMAVSEQLPLEDCIRESGINNLSVLTAGPIPPNPAEILQSARFAALQKELLSRFDRVIFDSPPVVPVTDAAILSKIVDGVVLVVRGFRTPKTAARQAVRQLLDVKAHIVGVVLNAIDLDRSEYREYHYYYRRDGYYSYRSDEAAP